MQTTDFVATVFDGKSNPNKVTVTFTMALNALLKGHTATIILMVEAVELGKPGAATGMDIGKPFEPVASLLDKFLEKGGRIVICGACMIHNGMTAIPDAHHYYHGEKVAFGTLTQLVLENASVEEIETVAALCHSVGLPITLAQLDIKEDICDLPCNVRCG